MKAVVFDFGAVLVRWQPVQLLRQLVPEHAPDDAAAAALAARIFESLTPDSDWARFDRGLVGVPELAGRIAARVGIPVASVRRVIDGIPDHLEPQSDCVALLRRLKAAGHRLYFLSNMPLPFAEHLERRHEFVADFDDGIFSARVGLMKPQRAVFELAQRRFGLLPAATLFIDDHAGNVDAARALGWQGLRYEDAGQCARTLRALGWV